MAKKSAPKKKSAAAKQPAPTKKPAAKKPIKKAAAKRSQPAASKRKPKESSAGIAKAKPASTKNTTAKNTTAKSTRNRRNASSAAATSYLATVNGWRRDVFAGLGKIIQRADPAKAVAADSLGWLKSRAARVKQAGQRELHELVRVVSKLKEVRRAPATVGRRKTKSK